MYEPNSQSDRSNRQGNDVGKAAARNSNSHHHGQNTNNNVKKGKI